MPTRTIELLRSETVASETMAFYFTKPEDFDFTAGQYAQLTLLEPPETDDEGIVRTFTIASAPFEKELIFTTRMRDTAFKRVLKNASPGTTVNMDGPFGNLILHENSDRPAVFLIGGIGITPVRSIVKQAHHDHRPHRLVLFYSNRTPRDAAFLDEFLKIDKEWDNFRLIATMTQVEKSEDWPGEKDKISRGLLDKYLDNLSDPVFYAVGSFDMVKSITGMLREADVAEESIKYEEFIGY